MQGYAGPGLASSRRLAEGVGEPGSRSHGAAGSYDDSYQYQDADEAHPIPYLANVVARLFR